MLSRSLQSPRHIQPCTAHRRRLGMTPNISHRDIVHQDYCRSECYRLIESLLSILIHTIARAGMAVRVEAPKDDIAGAKSCVGGCAIGVT